MPWGSLALNRANFRLATWVRMRSAATSYVHNRPPVNRPRATTALRPTFGSSWAPASDECASARLQNGRPGTWWKTKFATSRVSTGLAVESLDIHGPLDRLMAIPSWRRGRTPVAAFDAGAAHRARDGHANLPNRCPSLTGDMHSECANSLAGKSSMPRMPRSAR